MQAQQENITLITGATGGLGKAIAEIFYKNDISVLLVSRSLEKLQELSDELRNKYPNKNKVYLYSLDFEKAKELDYQNFFQHTTINKIHPNILVNNAGIIGEFGESWKIPTSAYETAFQVNLYSAIEMCRLFLPKMIEKNYGKIINISGGGATSARENFSPYSLSKIALVRYMENLSKELLSLGVEIDVNSIAPGAMKTKMTEQILNTGDKKAGKKEIDSLNRQLKDGGIPPMKAAELCYFLGSKESDGITGRLFSVVWDDWKTLPQRWQQVKDTDIYTLRRITARDRGFDWDK